MLGGMDICHQICSQIPQLCCLEEQFSMFSICERAKLFAGAANAVKILLSLISELNFSVSFHSPGQPSDCHCWRKTSERHISVELNHS